MEEIKDLFPDPEFVEAAGVLEVIKNTPEQMDNYISRLKYQLDEVSRMESVRIEALMEGETKGRTEGRVEGRMEGRAEGELIGRIESFQEILGISDPTHDELCGYDMQKLTALFDQLRLQIRSRRSD